MDQQNPKFSVLAQVICGAWIVSAQIWYYVQFRALFRAALAPLLGRLWR